MSDNIAYIFYLFVGQNLKDYIKCCCFPRSEDDQDYKFCNECSHHNGPDYSDFELETIHDILREYINGCNTNIKLDEMLDIIDNIILNSHDKYILFILKIREYIVNELIGF
jgi:hypothetical protein